MTGTLEEYLCTFMTISGLILLRMGNISDRFVVKIKTHILCSIISPPKNHAVYELTWKNIVEPDGPLMTIYNAHALGPLDN